MNNEREILLNYVATVINMQPTNDMFLRIMTSGDKTVVKSLAKFFLWLFKQTLGVKITESNKFKFIFKLKYFV